MASAQSYNMEPSIEYEATKESMFNTRMAVHLTGIIGTYLLLILKCLPSYMANRKAYNLKAYIVVYNTSLVILCIYTVKRILEVSRAEVLPFWSYCDDQADSLQKRHYKGLLELTFWLKVLELSETIVFILRKKYEQASFLHVFHHCSTVVLGYMWRSSAHLSLAMFPLLLNTTVHIIMYSYYLAAAVCDKSTMRRLRPIKQSITIMQMVQFVLMLSHAVIAAKNCTIEVEIVTLYAFCILIIFYGFYDFYKKTYTSPSDSAKPKVTQG